MKGSVTLTVIALFLAVTGAYIYWTPPPAPQVKPEISRAPLKILPADEKAPIRWLQIQNFSKNETLTLKKQNGKWMICFPVSYPADPAMADGLVTALRLSNRARRLMPEKNWEEYGLLKPALKIGVQTEENEKRGYLYVGDPSPVGPFVFARWEGDKEYFLVSEDLKKAFSRTLYSMRLKQVFRTPLNQVTRLRIRTLDKEYEMEKKQGEWQWLEPIPLLGKKISKKYADQIVMQYADLYVKEFLDDEKKQESEMGFSLISPWIKLWGQGSKEAVEEIKIGKEMPERDSFLALRKGESPYFLVARQNVRKLFQIFETMSQIE